jgi:hypothetical protein
MSGLQMSTFSIKEKINKNIKLISEKLSKNSSK